MSHINERKVSFNPMTDKQRRHIYFLLSRLDLTKDFGDEMCPQWTDGRAWKISELQFIDALNIIKYLNGLLQTPRGQRPNDFEMMDKKRKGLIKAVFRWYELQGKAPSMDYVLGTICKAGNVNYINELTETDLHRLYAEFCRKQTALQTMNKESRLVFSNN